MRLKYVAASTSSVKSSSALLLIVGLSALVLCSQTAAASHSATHGSDVEPDDSSHSSWDAEPDDARTPSPWRKPSGGVGRHRRAKDDGVCELEIYCGGGKGDDGQRTAASSGTVRLPIRGQRGPPGPPGPPGEKGQKGQDAGGDHGGAARRKVAFFAGLSENMGPITENVDVKFDRVVTNVGNAYDHETGKFTAPVDGVYQFNVVISAQGRQKAAVMILKNGEMVTTVWAESVPSWATSSNVAVLSLSKGDKVWLSLLSRASYLHGYMYSTYSGFIIFDN